MAKQRVWLPSYPYAYNPWNAYAYGYPWYAYYPYFAWQEYELIY